MPVAKWYLLANPGAYSWLCYVASVIAVGLFLAIFVGVDNLDETTRKRLAIAIIPCTAILLVGVLVCLFEAFTGRGWR